MFCFGPSGPADLGDLIYGLDFDFSALAAEITAQLQSALATPQFELGVDLFPLFSQGLVTNWSFSGGSISDITVNWDAVFGYLAAAPVALPLPGISGGLTWDELLAALRANPLTLLLASILVQTGGPPNFPQHNCPDKNHFWDPAKSPGTNWQWTGNGPVGSSQGSWYNTITGESLHPDLNHPGPIGPHWDYTDPTGQIWRCNPDGTFSKKNGN
ncbi:MAG TPA: polymorphic toxin type 37 domain-containing protein [Bryobacteraceae bacterium]|nr:polymorphic toxin type 37 domain-containing protein [Bryobacteraceae bacterium]